MSGETFLVTGACGCIGSWVIRNLVQEGVGVVAADLASDPVRPRLLLTSAELEQVNFVQNDIIDLDAVLDLVNTHKITHIIHLAGLQIPFCKANPSLGAQVNVVGTVNVFEAARRFSEQVAGLAYASSLAVLGGDDFYAKRPVGDDVPLYPRTLYGVYKQANEDTARLYWQDWHIGSVGLRPFIVYGLARDQGMTSDITKAILAATVQRPFNIRFDGQVALHYADDVAKMFIAAARAGYQGAAACNLRNDVIEIADFVDKLKDAVPNAEITYFTNQPLDYPADLDDSGLHQIMGDLPYTPLETAIAEMLAQFQGLLDQGQIDLKQLEQ